PCPRFFFVSFTDTAPTQTSPLSLHDALPIFLRTMLRLAAEREELRVVADQQGTPTPAALIADVTAKVLRQPPGGSGLWHLTASRSEEHTSEFQSRENLVCRLLLEKKKLRTSS